MVVDGTVTLVIDVVLPVLDEAAGSFASAFARITDQIDGPAESEDAA